MGVYPPGRWKTQAQADADAETFMARHCCHDRLPAGSFPGLGVDEGLNTTGDGRKVAYSTEVGYFEVLPNGRMGVVLGKKPIKEAMGDLDAFHRSSF